MKPVTILKFIATLVSSFVAVHTLAEVSSAEGLRLSIDKNGYYVGNGEDRLLWYMPDRESIYPSYIYELETVHGKSGDSYLHVTVRHSVEECAYWSYLFTHNAGKIEHWAFDHCETPLSAVTPNILLTTKTVSNLCSTVAVLEEILNRPFPIALRVVRDVDGEIVLEQVRFEEASKLVAMTVAYQQFFNSAFQEYQWSDFPDDESERLKEMFGSTKTSMGDKYQSFIELCSPIEFDIRVAQSN